MKSDRRACATARPPLAQSPPAALLRVFFFRSESIRPAKGTQLLRPRRTAAHFSADSSQLQLLNRKFKRGAGLEGPAPPLRPAPRRSPRSESILFINRIFGFGTMSQKIVIFEHSPFRRISKNKSFGRRAQPVTLSSRKFKCGCAT